MSLSNKDAASFYHWQAETVRGDNRALGIETGWAAPVAIFDASDGFGEEAWVTAMPTTVLACRLGGGAVTWLCGKHTGRGSGQGAVVLQSKGTPNHSTAKSAVRFAHIYLSDSLIDRVADAIRPGTRSSGSLRDDLVFPIDRDLDRRTAAYASRSLSGASSLELEADAILLVSHLLRSHHGFSERKRATGGLAPWQLKRACEAMVGHMEKDIRLDTLSDVAGCSPTHFSRAFKQSTGVPPFQWLLQRRVERAQALLIEGALPLAEIALAVGFAAQAQFTTAFKRVTGETPGAWRRGLRT